MPGPAALRGVAAVSAGDVWAVGSAILHWDGRQWKRHAAGRGWVVGGVGGRAERRVGGGQRSTPLGRHGLDCRSRHHRRGHSGAHSADVWVAGGAITRHYAARCPVPTPPPTAPASPTPCTGFGDVHPADYFYAPVQYLVAQGAISGYGDCSFRPYASTTRSQVVKIVVLGFAARDRHAGGRRLYLRRHPPTSRSFPISRRRPAGPVGGGYGCGAAGEPCDGQERPYFRPYADVTRGQLSKIDRRGRAQWSLINPATPTFADVPPADAFYPFVETAACPPS